MRVKQLLKTRVRLVVNAKGRTKIVSDEQPRVLSFYLGVPANKVPYKKPQHPTRPGDKDGEGGAASSTKRMPDQRAGGSEGPVGAAWRWEQLYFEYEVGKACRCVGEMCECDYSNTKMMPDELNKRRKKLRATDPCST